MARILKRVEAHYETREVPFGMGYVWRSAHVTVECDCGQTLAFDVTSTPTTCRCGVDLGAFVGSLEEPQGRLPDKLAHPWFHDAQARAQQRLRDEAAYPKGSPWRYDDITSGSTNGE